MVRTSLSNALTNFLALHAKVADENVTVVVTGGAWRDVAWISAGELEQLRVRAEGPRKRDLTRICVALERAERRGPSSEEIVRELKG